MTISSKIQLKEAYLSHRLMINCLLLELKTPGANKKELQRRIAVLQEMADAADNELMMIKQKEES
mgnify:CR=1 FL=1